MSPPSEANKLQLLKEELNAGSAGNARVSQFPKRPPSKAPSSGVVRVIDDANLFDFVQQECMRGLTRAVLAHAGGSEGVLYFDDGQLVHAEVADIEGEEAALAILCWRHARVEPSQNMWILANTIETSWQGLLMKAAHRLDEIERSSEITVPKAHVEKAPADLEEFAEFSDTNLTRAVHLDSEGEVIASRGDLQDFPDAVCYAARLAELIGEGLGLERFCGLECVTTKRTMIVHVDEDSLVAVEAELSADLTLYRKRAGT
jgi:hypothetical protein